MPLQMDEDGNIVDEPDGRAGRGPEPRRRAGDGGSPASPGPRTADIVRPTQLQDDAPNAPGRGSPGARRQDVPTERVGGGKTIIYRPPRGAAPGGDRPGAAGAGGRPGPGPMADPPVGWLTIVKGPGRGRVVTLGQGRNSIGRDPTERVPLPFGDESISKKEHCVITYEPRSRKFSVQPGRGSNLTYVDDEPVLVSNDLEPSMQVQMGDTVLRFVPLCGAGFSWDDESDGD